MSDRVLCSFFLTVSVLCSILSTIFFTHASNPFITNTKLGILLAFSSSIAMILSVLSSVGVTITSNTGRSVMMIIVVWISCVLYVFTKAMF